MSKVTLNKERKAYCQGIHTLTGGSQDATAVLYLTNLLEFTSCLLTKEKALYVLLHSSTQDQERW